MLIAFRKTLQRLKQECQKNPALGPCRQTDVKNLGLVWRNRKKISQIINAHPNLPFFLLIILCMRHFHENYLSKIILCIVQGICAGDAGSPLLYNAGSCWKTVGVADWINKGTPRKNYPKLNQSEPILTNPNQS
jgi:hypothetical protein